MTDNRVCGVCRDTADGSLHRESQWHVEHIASHHFEPMERRKTERRCALRSTTPPEPTR